MIAVCGTCDKLNCTSVKGGRGTSAFHGGGVLYFQMVYTVCQEKCNSQRLLINILRWSLKYDYFLKLLNLWYYPFEDYKMIQSSHKQASYHFYHLQWVCPMEASVHMSLRVQCLWKLTCPSQFILTYLCSAIIIIRQSSDNYTSFWHKC